MKNIFIGSGARNGGSLLARLFDHHPDVASYPFELVLPLDQALHPIQRLRGQRFSIQNYPTISDDMDIDEVISKVSLSREQKSCLLGKHFSKGKLVGKTAFMDVNATYHHEQFIADFIANLGKSRRLEDIYNSVHRALFTTWDNGKHAGTNKYVVYHSGNGLFADIPLFLDEFKDSFFIQPIRSVNAFLASEKLRVVTQQIGWGKITKKIKLPDTLLRFTFGRFFENALVNWLITLTRSVLLKKHLGDRYIIYRHEGLVRNPRLIMKGIADRVGMEFNEELLTPSEAGYSWKGNSVYGKQAGIDQNTLIIHDVFNKTETELIGKYCGEINQYLDQHENQFIDWDSFDVDLLLDYSLQKHYFSDREKTALYLASMYERLRYNTAWNNLKSGLKRNPTSYYL